MPVSTERRYTAFLSYRHADNKEEGRRWAEWLHQAIETYEVPTDLAGKPNLRGEPIPTSLYPVFRDEEELPADADLSDNIQRALRNSSFLIVLCSPRACESRFVDEEIRAFKELGKGNRILALMLDGEPNASDDPAKAKQGLRECLPEALRFGVQKSGGKVDWAQRCEPIAADVRPEGKPEQGYTSSAAYRSALEKRTVPAHEARRGATAYKERLQLARLKVIAGLLGVPLGQLRDRDAAFRLKKAHRRQILITAFAVFALILGSLAYWQRGVAVTQKAETERINAEQKRLLTIASWGQFNEADRELYDASRANRGNPLGDGMARDKTQSALLHLARAIQFDPSNRHARERFGWEVTTRRNDLRMPPISTFAGVGKIENASLSPDGKRAVTIGDKTTIWNSTTGKRETEIPVGANQVATAFSADGKRMACAGKNGLVTVWDLSTSKLLAQFDPGVQPYEIKFNVGGDLILGMAKEGSFAWTVTGARINSFSSKDYGSIDFSLDGSRWLTQGKVVTHVREVPSGRILCTVLSLDESRVELSPQGRFLAERAAGSTGKTVKLWNCSSGERIITLKHEGAIIRTAFDPNETHLAVSTESDVAVWDLTDGKWNSVSLPEGSPTGLQFSPGGKRLTIDGSGEEKVRLWDVEGRIVASYSGCVYLKDVSFSPDGTRLLFNCLSVADADPPATTHLVSVNETTAVDQLMHPDLVIDASFSIDGRTILTVCRDGIARMWSAETGKEQRRFQASEKITCASFSPDGKSFITAGGGPEPDDPSTITSWRLADGQSSAAWHHSAHVDDMYSSPDGKRLLTMTTIRATAHLWDMTEGKLIAALPHKGTILQGGFNMEGTQIITCGGEEGAKGEVKFWDALTGSCLKTIVTAEKVNGFCVSPDGARIALATGDTWGARNSVIILDRVSGKTIATHRRMNYTPSVQYSKDGASILVVGWEGSELLDAATGDSRIVFNKIGGTKGVFDSSGARVVIGGNNSDVTLWSATTGKQLGRIGMRGDIFRLSFSPDESRLLFLGNGLFQGIECKSVGLSRTTIPRALAFSNGPPEDYEVIAKALSQMRIGQNGELSDLTTDERERLPETLSKIAAKPSAEGVIAKWLLEDRILPREK